MAWRPTRRSGPPCTLCTATGKKRRGLSACWTMRIFLIAVGRVSFLSSMMNLFSNGWTNGKRHRPEQADGADTSLLLSGDDSDRVGADVVVYVPGAVAVVVVVLNIWHAGHVLAVTLAFAEARLASRQPACRITCVRQRRNRPTTRPAAPSQPRRSSDAW